MEPILDNLWCRVVGEKLLLPEMYGYNVVGRARNRLFQFLANGQMQ